MEELLNRLTEVETIEQAIALYSDASEEEKALKEIKASMSRFIKDRLERLGVDRVELDNGIVGFTSPSEKTVIDEEQWKAYLKKDLRLAKFEVEREKLRERFTSTIQPSAKVYIKPRG